MERASPWVHFVCEKEFVASCHLTWEREENLAFVTSLKISPVNMQCIEVVQDSIGLCGIVITCSIRTGYQPQKH